MNREGRRRPRLPRRRRFYTMHATMTRIPPDLAVYAVRVYAEGADPAKFDAYFTSVIAVVGEDGIPEVELFAPPKMDRATCRQVREALGKAFAAHGFMLYRRRMPGTGQLITRHVLGGRMAAGETKGI